MMVIYDPNFGGGTKVFNKGKKQEWSHNYSQCWTSHYYDGCFGDRKDTPSKSTWVVPGTWPEWAL